MAIKKNTKVALVRGNSLNEWEGKLWESLPGDIEVTGFCGRKNLYALNNIAFPVERLSASTDTKANHLFSSYIQAGIQKMNGLESRLCGFTIAHTAEIYHFYTYQAVRAKQQNKELKVVITVWDNSFGRFEYNYASGLKHPPYFWRKKMNDMIRQVVQKADFFLPVTSYSKALLLEYGVSDAKMKILTPGIVTQETAPLHPDQILEELHVAPSTEIYLMVNRLVKEKGVYDVLYAWKMYVKQRGSGNKILLIIGSGPEQKNMQRLVEEWGLERHVKFVSYLSNDKVKQLYKKARCLMLGSYATPLWQEQFGFVLAEAIIQTCPVIAATSGAIPEVVEHAGILVQPSQPVDMYHALQKLDNEVYFQELKKVCGVLKSKFDAATFRKSLVEVYRGLVE